ncbi:MAG TPA: transposase [Dermatophilaceae bacterium]|nr:transposase [Dermatophilaceae bacterium]
MTPRSGSPHRVFGNHSRRSFVPWVQPQRVWAVEGANGVGRPLVQRLLESGEQVLDVPAKLAARVRLFDTGHNRNTDALDAHSIAMVAVRTKTLPVLQVDGELEALRMLTDRREALTRRGVQTVDRLQALRGATGERACPVSGRIGRQLGCLEAVAKRPARADARERGAAVVTTHTIELAVGVHPKRLPVLNEVQPRRRTGEEAGTGRPWLYTSVSETTR